MEKEEENRNESNEPQKARESDDFVQNDWDENTDTDKYLAMEQPGVTYTGETRATLQSDDLEFGSEENSDKFKTTGENSRNSDAFSQDDYILRDNIDLDEDQNQSISSEDNDK